MRQFWCVVVLLLFAVSAQAQTVTVVEAFVTYGTEAQLDGVIAGDATVFTDFRAGSADIFWSTEQGDILPLSLWPSSQTQPAVSGTTVVFVSDYAGDENIHTVDLLTGSETLLTYNSDRDYAPAISQENVVFVSERAGSPDIFWYSMVTGDVLPLATTDGYEHAPAIDGNLVAWQVYGTDRNYDIFATVLNGPPVLVAGGAGDQAQPSVSGSLIAYRSDGDVFVYDHATGQTTQISDEGILHQNIIIDGRRIYWQDNSSGNQDIYVHDIDIGLTFQLTFDPTNQVLTDAKDNRVVYTDYRFGDANIVSLTYTINTLPVATAGADQGVYLGDTAQLLGTASDDDGDAIVSWQWTIDSAPLGSNAALSNTMIANPTFSPDLLGTYVLSLVASDPWDDSLPSTMTITVSTAAIMVTPSAGLHGSLSPDVVQVLSPDETTSFTVTPDSGYAIDTVSGCGGSLLYNVFTTAPVTANCTVTATFTDNIPDPVLLESTHGRYTTIQTAYDSIIGGSDTIKVKAGDQAPANLTFDHDVAIRLEGGYDGIFSTVVSDSEYSGTLTIKGGQATISDLIIK